MTYQIDREMHDALTEYLTHLYAQTDKHAYTKDRMSFESEIGRNYIHVIRADSCQRSSHSWIVHTDTKKFRRGTILKSATWKAPATNFGRGDVFTPNSYISRADWTGIA